MSGKRSCWWIDGLAWEVGMHVDLDSGGSRESEVARLVALGATHVADKDEWGHCWTVLTDPEGNEFYVS